MINKNYKKNIPYEYFMNSKSANLPDDVAMFFLKLDVVFYLQHILACLLN